MCFSREGYVCFHQHSDLVLLTQGHFKSSWFFPCMFNYTSNVTMVMNFQWRFLFFFFSSTSLLLPTHLPPPSCTHAQSYNPMDFSPPDSSVHGFFQARILEWVAISFSRRFLFLLTTQPSLFAQVYL